MQIIPFVGVIIRKYELRQQCHLNFITRRVVTPKKKADISLRQNVLLTVRMKEAAVA
jgi:hypothetical protein